MDGTLAFWTDKLIGHPKTIECPSMQLIGRDHEGTFVTGPGKIVIESDSDIRFYLYGQADDYMATMKKIRRSREYEYDALEQFRLLATDYDGVEWQGGYVAVDFFQSFDHGLPLTGMLDALTTHDNGDLVNRKSSVELLLVPNLRLPLPHNLVSSKQLGERVLSKTFLPGQYSIDILGTQVTFSSQPDHDALYIYAETSENLGHPYLENWLTEPLRILLGGPVYPSLGARNFGDGRSYIWRRRSPRGNFPSNTGLAAGTSHPLSTPATFWNAYKVILKYLAINKKFETDEITSLYSEVSGANMGSRWVFSMTLANTIEALSKKAMTDKDKASEFAASDVAAMKKHLKNFEGDAAVRQRMLSNLGNLRSKSILTYLRGLEANGKVEAGRVETWRSLRNSVLHGELVEPWPSSEGDQRLKDLLELVHCLTWVVLEQSLSTAINA